MQVDVEEGHLEAGPRDLLHNTIESSEGAAPDSSAASAQVLSSATDLSRQSEMLRNEVSKFLDPIRAA
jgi:methyl-accepting chemotaxis protein